MKGYKSSKTSKRLLENLTDKKKEYLDSGRIRKKKDKLKYPITAPFNIPDSWSWAYLTEVSIIQEGPGIRKHQYSDDGMQFLTVTNILEGSVDFRKSQKYISIEEFNEKYQHFKIAKGDIVTACSGASWGKSAMFNYDNEMILNTSTLRLRFFGDLGSNKFLYFLTKTDYFKKNLSSHSTGQQPNYGYSHYSQIPIPIPPLPEQKQIVTLLDAAFAKIDQAKANLEKNIANAKELFQSKLNEVFSQKGEGWEEKSLGEVCEKTKNIKWQDYTKEEFEYIDLSAVSRETLKITSTTKVNKENAPSRAKKIILKGDVIFATTRPTLRRTTIIEDDFSGNICSTGYVVLRPKINIASKWIFFFLLTSTFMRRMEKLQRGASYPAVTDSDVKGSKLSIPLIQELEEYNIQLMSELYKNVNVLVVQFQKKIEILEELKKSLLQKAFSGQLPQY